MPDLTINQVDVAKLSIQKGDVIMVKVDRLITQGMAALIRDRFREVFERTGGDMPEILVVDGSVKVTIVRDERKTETADGS